MFDFLREHNLYAKESKCEFLKKEIHYLGHVISLQGVHMDMSKVDAIVHWPHPTNLEELQIFLGLAGFYRKYVRDYAKIVVPMTDQLKGKGKTFTWDEEQQRSFEKLKVALASAPILAIVDPTKSFVVEIDASDRAIGAVLQPRSPMAVGQEKEKIQSVKYFLEDMNDMLKAACESIRSAEDRAQTYANKARIKVTFEKDDFVFLKVPALKVPAKWG
ncbi:hypothetical protein L7F22_054801 [Adiantum nelumboides]|nr:hypothetical protein [Adiantum nelumboides]